MRLVPDRIDSAVGAGLVTALLRDLEQRYGGPDPDEPLAADLAPPNGIFIVAWRDEQPVGCGGVRLHQPGVGEIKRMYVHPDARRNGIAETVLATIEEHARTLGYARLVLETGTMQPEAIALYEKRGYEAIAPYGMYRESPLSRCFAKTIGETPTTKEEDGR